jgi:hypothetical protein
MTTREEIKTELRKLHIQMKIHEKSMNEEEDKNSLKFNASYTLWQELFDKIWELQDDLDPPLSVEERKELFCICNDK